METIVKNQKSVAKQMLEEKEQIQEYLKTNDESQKPKGVKFVGLIPLSACKG
ncbi:hypothetical protein GCM10028808_73120 [Spirosoma migulaei]